jgi:4-hydroxyphenylpyruvate dioxygenase-like putative hemolysin
VQSNFLATHGEGINHLGFRVEDCENVVRVLVGRGFRVIASGKIAGGGQFAYIDTDKTGGVVFELIQTSA